MIMRNMLVSIAIMTILIIPACVNKTYSENETYYEKEKIFDNRTETTPKTEMVLISKTSGNEDLQPINSWFSDYIRMTQEPKSLNPNDQLPLFNITPTDEETGIAPSGVWYYKYKLTHNKNKLTLGITGPSTQRVINSNTPLGFPSRYYWANTVKIQIYDALTLGDIGNPPPPSQSEIDSFYTFYGYNDTDLGRWLRDINDRLSRGKIIYEETYKFTDSWQRYNIETQIAKQDIIILIWGPKANWEPNITLHNEWIDEKWENRTITQLQTPPSYKEELVPKTRTILKTKKVPIWELFMN